MQANSCALTKLSSLDAPFCRHDPQSGPPNEVAKLGRRQSCAFRRATLPAVQTTMPTVDDKPADETGAAADDLLDLNTAVRISATSPGSRLGLDSPTQRVTYVILETQQCASHQYHARHVCNAQMALFLRGYPADAEAAENKAVIRVKYDVAQALAQQILATKEVRAAVVWGTHRFSGCDRHYLPKALPQC